MLRCGSWRIGAGVERANFCKSLKCETTEIINISTILKFCWGFAPYAAITKLSRIFKFRLCSLVF